MANTVIQIKGSGVTGNVPSTLEPGELAINYVDGKLFYGDQYNTVTLFDVITEPSGLEGELQFNDSGSFGATANVRYDSINGELIISQATIAGQNIQSLSADVDVLQAETANLINDKVNRAGDVMTGDLVLTQNVRSDIIIANTTIYAGIATEQSTRLPNVIAQFSSNAYTYTQVNQQNIDPHGSADFVVTADVGTDTDFYVDMGFSGSQYNYYDGYDTPFEPLTGYLLVQGSTINQLGGNMIIGTTSPAGNIRIIAGGFETSNVVAKIDNDGFIFTKDVTIEGNLSSGLTNIIYDQANSAYGHAQAAFDKANTGVTGGTTASADYFPRGDYGYLTSSMYAVTGFTAELIGSIYDMREEPIIPTGYDLEIDFGYLA